MSQGFTKALTTPVPVAQGGTGVTSFTPNAVIAGGTLPTSPNVSIAPVQAGYVLTDNGALLPPTMQSIQPQVLARVSLGV